MASLGPEPPKTRSSRRRTRSRWALDWLKAASDRKSTRLNSSHLVISYAVFCLKKKKQHKYTGLSVLKLHATYGTGVRTGTHGIGRVYATIHVVGLVASCVKMTTVVSPARESF